MKEHHGKITLMELPTLKQPQTLLDQLGGTIKISMVIGAYSRLDETTESDLFERIQTIKPTGKLKFSLNLYPSDPRPQQKLLKALKESLKAAGRNARFLNHNKNANSAQIVKGGLMKHGTDLNLIKIDDQWLLSQSIAIQNAADYALRDYKKPVRLTKSGMLPPKLAQMMINFSQFVRPIENWHDKILYDAFCGSGTVLGEGIIKGMDVIGSDIDAEAIDAAKTNTEWLSTKRLIPRKPEWTIFKSPAQDVGELPQAPDMVVSEVYLGPPLSDRHIPVGKIQDIQAELTPLYVSVFKNLYQRLKPHNPLVMAFPRHYSDNEAYSLPFEQIFNTKEFQIIERLNYHRSDQVVGREILVLERLP
jgi:tRNA G10  N-methylase Trm11